jgi:hypothetical protein
MRKIFYEKLPNGRYKAVREYDGELMDSLPLGYHLIHVKNGGCSRRVNVNPDFIALSAAANSIEEILAKIIRAQSETLARVDDYTEKQKMVLKEVQSRLLEVGIHRLYYPSTQEVAEKVLKEITKLAETTSHLPAVKDIEDKYKMVLALAYEQKT